MGQELPQDACAAHADPAPVNAPAVAEAMAPLRRQFIAEALDGMIFQAQGVLHFLHRADDACAERALAYVFDFAREAAGEMKALRAAAQPTPAA